MLLRRRRGASALTHCGRSARRHPREGGERRQASAMLNEVPACAGMTKLRDLKTRGTSGGLAAAADLDVGPTTRGQRPTWGARSALRGVNAVSETLRGSVSGVNARSAGTVGRGPAMPGGGFRGDGNGIWSEGERWAKLRSPRRLRSVVYLQILCATKQRLCRMQFVTCMPTTP